MVYQVDDLKHAEDLQQIARQEAAPATCFYKAVSKNTYQIRFFNSTHEIQLCGHGLLATAKVVAEHESAERFTFQVGVSQAENNRLIAEYDRTNNQVWVIFSEIEVAETITPDWVGQIFSENPFASYIAGPDDGYWLMEWPQSFDLTNLQVDCESLKHLTQRAVIATQRADDRFGYDYYFRYFAPQHGVNEDKATGSAHRVLVSYWSKRLNKTNLLAKQLSKEGAELTGRYEKGDVWISGNVLIHG